MTTTTIILALIWYLIGSLGGMWISRKMYPSTSIFDLIVFFTAGGILGALNVIIGFIFWKFPEGWLHKKLF